MNLEDMIIKVNNKKFQMFEIIEKNGYVIIKTLPNCVSSFPYYLKVDNFKLSLETSSDDSAFLDDKFIFKIVRQNDKIEMFTNDKKNTFVFLSLLLLIFLFTSFILYVILKHFKRKI